MNRTVHTRFASFAQTHSLRMLILLATLLLGSVAAMAQSTAFSYQGRLNDGANAANGAYEIQFKLFDAVTGGTQVGTTFIPTPAGVVVTNGAFTVTLDFGATAFPGADRWLEISVKPPNGAAFTTLTPRQKVTATPYAIKSLSADGLSASCNGCVTGTQIGSLPATSTNYIQNGTALQANSNFNISGNGIFGGRVGIQTGGTAPTQALDVNGTIGVFDFNPRILSAGIGTEVGAQLIQFGVNSDKFGALLNPAIQGGYFRVDTRASQGGLFQFRHRTGALLLGIEPDGTMNGNGSFNISGNGIIGGNVGIGTPTPSDRLQINGDLRLGLQAGTTTTSTYGGRLFFSGGTKFGAGDAENTDPMWMARFNSAADVSELRLNLGDNNAANSDRFSIGSTPPNSTTFTPSFTFDTNETMRVGNINRLTAGQTKRILFGDAEYVSVSEADIDDQLVLAAGNFRFKKTDLSRGDGNVEPNVDNSMQLGSSALRWSALFAANGVIQTSDARMKQGIAGLGYGLRDLMQLRPVSFQWKDNKDGRTHLGLIAQEVEAVIPEAVIRDADAKIPLGMNYTDLIPVVIKAVQEQQSALDRKDAELKAVKAENEALGARLAVLEQMMQQLKGQAEKQQPKQQ